jgi:hypothetical protein
MSLSLAAAEMGNNSAVRRYHSQYLLLQWCPAFWAEVVNGVYTIIRRCPELLGVQVAAAKAVKVFRL